jgi:hypothetical protein
MEGLDFMGAVGPGVWSLCVVSIMALGAGANAQTRPATQPLDASTPKGALRLLNFSLRDGDVKTIEEVLLATTPQERWMVEARAHYAAALAALHKSAAAAFGDEGAKTVTSDLEGESSQGLAAIDKAEVSTDADEAFVRYPGAQDRPIRLVRVKGMWKVSLPPIDSGTTTKQLDLRITELDELTRQADALAAEIAGGKFADAEKAAEAWRNRVLQTVAPTTQPGK